jgi:exopolysaccharide biosynthesis polyprenyl glycosylphosphotransferase
MPPQRVTEDAVERAHAFSLRRHRGAWRDALLRRILALADFGAGIAVSISLGVFSSGHVNLTLWSALLAPAWVLLAKLSGLYDRDQRSLRHLTVDELPRIVTWALAGTVALTFLLALTPAGQLSAGRALQAWIVASVAAFVLRAFGRLAWRYLTPPERTLIVGEGPLAVQARRKLQLFPDMHVELIGQRPEIPVEELRGATEDLSGIDRIILASSSLDERLIAELVAFCRRRQIKLSVIPPARGMFGTAVQLNHIADLPVVEYNTWDVSRSTLLLKRVLDIGVSVVALVALAPVFVLVSIAILLESRGSPVFVQTRAGQGGTAFRMLKFRTMVANAEELLPQLLPFDQLGEPMFKLVGDPRVTRMGRILRRWSIDETPQLVNVLLGHMSLVGPRPEQIDLVERYAEEHRFRLLVKPGLTGPMQIYGRGQLTLQERLAVEREYVENISIVRDLRILVMTIAPVFSGRGAF